METIYRVYRGDIEKVVELIDKKIEKYSTRSKDLKERIIKVEYGGEDRYSKENLEKWRGIYLEKRNELEGLKDEITEILNAE